MTTHLPSYFSVWQVYTAQFFVWIISVLYEQVRTGVVNRFRGKNFDKLFICFNIKSFTSRSLASPVSFRHKLSTITKQFFFSVREDANLNVHFTWLRSEEPLISKLRVHKEQGNCHLLSSVKLTTLRYNILNHTCSCFQLKFLINFKRIGGSTLIKRTSHSFFS